MPASWDSHETMLTDSPRAKLSEKSNCEPGEPERARGSRSARASLPHSSRTHRAAFPAPFHDWIRSCRHPGLLTMTIPTAGSSIRPQARALMMPILISGY